MYSKLFRFATFLGVLCTASCSFHAPWSNEPIGQEVNVAFVFSNNLLYVPSVKIDGKTGRFLFGSAQAATVLDSRFAGTRATHQLQLNERELLPLTAVVADLSGVGDAIINGTVWGEHGVTIDYHAGLITLQREGIHPDMMNVYRYAGEPSITVTVDGQTVSAVVDTTSPDTLVLPGSANGRRSARVEIAGVDFGAVDVRTGGVQSAR